MKRLFCAGIVLVLSVLAMHAQSSAFASVLQKGDIVFQHLNGGELGAAIDKVTEGFGGKDYNHCGLVVSVNDTLKVVEAIGKNVCLSSVSAFEARCTVDCLLVGRLKPAYSGLIDAAQKAAMRYLGVLYDDYFEMDNGSLYCSELVYEAFKEANRGSSLFDLQPMTFKDPATGAFFSPWVAYYARLHYPIPEGKPGINPGLISRSSKIRVVFPSSGK